MQRWFLSYHSQDLDLAQALEVALKKKDEDAHIFFAPKSLRAGGRWLPRLAQEIHDATAFVLVVAQSGIGPWQVIEYNEALDKHVKAPDFPIILVLLDGVPAPGLPFLRQLHWIVTADVASESTVAQVLEAMTSGDAARPQELWRHAAPYRGLVSMREEDSDFFFGRAAETTGVLKTLHDEPHRMPLLVGNSGVGKSSLAQAGILASLKRQSWPEGTEAGPWPAHFHDSRQWCYLKLSPGTDPLRALVEPFLKTWQFETTDPTWERRQREWIEALLSGEATIAGLLNATERRYEEVSQPKPPAFFLYVDQGEELYVRSDERQRRRFSALLAQAVTDPRLRVLMSLRADFFGAVQNDEPLYAAHHMVNVPPLRVGDLEEVVTRPAKLLGARFETDGLPPDIARRTAEESARDAGALPLLSYLLDDMWSQMVKRGDGVLRLPAQAVELGGVLADRANAFLARNPESEEALRRIMTLKLATVREDGEPTRRHAPRSEFSDEEWKLVSELADHPNRLLIIATPEGQETYAEVAHEAIFRRWDKLRSWMAAQRDFLIWRSALESDRRQWEAAPEASRDDALLMGLALAQAQAWLAKRAEDLPAADLDFIGRSLKRDALMREQQARLRRRVLWTTVAALVVVSVFAIFAAYRWVDSARSRDLAVSASLHQAQALTTLAQEHLAQSDYEGALALARDALPADPGAVPSGWQAQYRALWDSAMAVLVQALSHDRLRAVLVDHIWSNGAVTDAAFSPNRKLVVTASDDGTARVWDARGGAALLVLDAHKARVNTAAFSPDGKSIVTASDDGTAMLWDAATGASVATLKAGLGKVRSAAFNNDGQQVLTASERGIVLWDAKTAGAVWTPEGTAGVFSPDGQWILAWRDGAAPTLFDVRTHVALAVFGDAHSIAQATVLAASFSPDGQRAVTAFDDGTAAVWDVHGSGEQARLTTLERHGGKVLTASFSGDGSGQYVLTTSDDQTARLWDAGVGTEVARMSGHGDVRAARFVPDGQLVLLAFGDGTAVLWDAADNKTLATFKGHELAVNAATFSADGLLLVTASDDHTARIWDGRADDGPIMDASSLAPPDRIQFAAIAATKNLTAGQGTEVGAHPQTAVARQNAANADPCDQLALGPDDRRKRGPLGAAAAAPSKDAIAACRAYADAHPNSSRDLMRLARALELGGAQGDAIAIYRSAANSGTAAAYYNLAVITWTGTGVTQDRKQALDLLKRGAEAGDGYCHRWLAELAEQGVEVAASLDSALWHHIAEANAFERDGDDTEARPARLRRASLAHSLAPQEAVKVSRQNSQ